MVVDEVQPGYAAHDAGLKPGDTLVGWERAATPPANPDPAAGTLLSPYDLAEVEREQAPRGTVTLVGARDGSPLRVAMPTDNWEMTARPALDAADLAAYDSARARDDSAALRALAGAKAAAGDHAGALWLHYRLAAMAAGKGRWDEVEAARAAGGKAAEAWGEGGARARVHADLTLVQLVVDRNQWDRAAAWHREMLEEARAIRAPSLVEARILRGLSHIAQSRGDLAAAENWNRQALSIREQLAPASLDVSQSLYVFGLLAWIRGDLTLAEDHHRHALSIRERLTPGGMLVAQSLNNIGVVTDMQGDLATGQEYYLRALAIQERRVPDGLAVAATLHNLGRVASFRGDLDGAEEYYRRSMAIKDRLAPVSLMAANSLANLGGLALTRGDFEAAEEHSARVLAIMETVAPRSLTVATALSILGLIARERGDLPAAEGYLSRANDLAGSLAPDSLEVANHLRELGEVARRQGRPAVAKERLLRALAIAERKAPSGVEATDIRQSLGDLALAEGDLDAAESHYRSSRDIRRALAATGSAGEAEACRGLATIARRRGRLQAALESYDCALAALEAQRQNLGGTEEVKAGFAARYAAHYRETLDLLLELDRPAEAFHVLERYRARGLLALMAERDLVFSADVPAELDRERRIANAEYERTLARLGTAKPEEAGTLREALAGLRRRQAVVQDRIRAASPRLAALQYPEPLDLAAARAALDPGTVLLSYSVGEQRSYVFAVGPGPDDFAAVRLDVGLARLREDVAELRRLLERERTLGRAQIRAVSGRLTDALLRPVGRFIARAERVLVVPDGPLHLIPFAVLGDPLSPGPRYFAEARPIHVAASATVFAELKKGRGSRRTEGVVAFGDPDYSAAPAAAGAQPEAANLRSARERGLDLRPLPASRGEAEELGRLYGARVYVGSGATEEMAKAVGTGASLIHFACHGLADEASPLDSSLALSLPRRGQAARENGLLHAWEIFEQVRIDADLVTLSACGSALGREMSGEGILGLTRAFQYAGARTVLASLWGVGDDNTAVLMKRFYRYLKQGLSKDRALRAAQLDMIRSGSSHPSRWAAFQLVGDWR